MEPVRHMTVTLPEELDRFVRDEVARGTSSSESAYVEHLVQERYETRRAEELDEAIAQGVADADAGRSMPAEDAFRRLKETLGLLPLRKQ